MDDRKVVDYFVVAGFDERDAETSGGVEDKSSMKAFKEPLTKDKAPITDIAVIFVDLGETVPEGYEVISKTPSGLSADLNHGSYRTHEAYLCYRRGRDKPPLVDVGAMYEGKEQILGDSEIVDRTPRGHIANVNNSSTPKTFFTFRRAQPTIPSNSLVVTDIAIIVKGEPSPHAFCVVKKNLNRALVGSDVFLCYKKSVNRARLINYSPKILLRYPFDDRPNLPLPETVPMFCMPMGCSLEKWPSCAQQADPIFSTFVLTVSDAAEKLYGSAVTFYEPYPREKLTDDQKFQLGVADDDNESFTYNINKCICLLSRWPFFETYDKFLMFLYEMSQKKGPHQVSIERYITYFLEDVPFPSPQRPRILVQLSLNDRLILTQPEDVPLPRSGAGFRQILVHLGPDNCLLILLCALTEQKILVHSLRPDLLTSIAEAISMIVFPFKWQCPYIPRCPLGLAEFLHAPLPFLIGVDSRFFDLYDPPPDVNCVDLDTNNITICEEKKNLSIKLLPKKPGRILRCTLERLNNKLQDFSDQSLIVEQQKSAENCIDKEFQLKKKEQALELEIQEAFLKFMANILKGYRNFLLPITKAPTVGTTDTNSLFDLQGFIRSRDKTYLKFYSYIVKTQMFIRFIEERSFVSDMDAGLAFFDECAEKVTESGDDVRLLEVDDSHQSERTVFIMPPEPVGPPNHSYYYDGFNVDPEELKKSCRPANDISVGGGGSTAAGDDRGDSLNRRFRSGNASNRFSSTYDDSSVEGGEANLSTSFLAPPPDSPMARRTKQEIKVAQKLACRLASSPQHWARCLLATCYSIWYIHLPSYAMISENPSGVLVYAYDRLLKAKSLRLDEICYRVMMQLCGLYSQPVLAVKLLNHMRNYGFQPNAITYGFYNRAVLEATWPSDMSNSGQLLWNKLRNAVRGVALFRRAGAAAGRRRMSNDDLMAAVGSSGGLAITSVAKLGGSRTSIDSVDGSAHGKFPPSESQVNPNSENFAAFEKFRSKFGTVVRQSGYQLNSPAASFNRQSFESSAGLLITGALGSTLKEESPLDLEQIDAVATPLALSTPFASSSTSSQVLIPGSHQAHHHHHPPGKRYYRSGSCSEFNPPPTSPPNPPSSLNILNRSESFAHDAGILAKLHMLKMESSGFQASQGTSQNSVASDSSPSKQLLVGQLNKPWQPKAVFKRRNSLTLKKFMDPTASDSYESSTENLGSMGSGAGGSIEDIYGERSATLDTPKRNRLLNALGAKLHRLVPAEDEGYGEEESSDAAADTTGSPPPASGASLTPTGGLVKSPSRTPVTENDPLGALDIDLSPIRGSDEGFVKKSSPANVSRAASEIELDVSGTPVLFDRRTAGRRWNSVVTRSATFADDEAVAGGTISGVASVHEGGGVDSSGGESGPSTLHRSSTVPSNVGDVNDVGGGGETGNSSFGSFKLPFSRYSPSRFSLRKTADRINTQLIENAINSFSSSSLTSKKSNELIMGGLRSLTSAATSMAKKIEGAISANSTPHKSGGSLRSTLERDACLYEDDSEYVDDSYLGGSGVASGGQTRRKISNEFSPLNRSSGVGLSASGLGTVAVPYGTAEAWGTNLFDWFAGGGGELSASSRKGSTAELAGVGGMSGGAATESVLNLVVSARPQRDPSIPVALEVIMTTCSKCHNCSSLLYDEEIMSGWIPEDSNLNTKCHFCDKATVPLLSVSVIDYRGSPMPATANKERKISSASLATSRTSLVSESVTNAGEGKSCEPIAVPYLNPLVLRKEFESILAAEGDVSLTRSKFVDEHPIIYWNIVWTFTRIGMESHLPGLALDSQTAAMAEPHSSWQNAGSSHVQISTMWHNTRLHDEVGQPMYTSWNSSNQPSSLVSALVTDHTPVQNSTMQKVISCLQCNDLQEPLKCLAFERQKCKGRGHSLYREILFLGILAIGRENIDQAVFDKEYHAAYERATERNDPKLYLKIDQPPSSGAIYCRRYFTPLDL